MDCIVHRVAKSQTWLSDSHFISHFTFHISDISLTWKLSGIKVATLSEMRLGMLWVPTPPEFHLLAHRCCDADQGSDLLAMGSLVCTVLSSWSKIYILLLRKFLSHLVLLFPKTIQLWQRFLHFELETQGQICGQESFKNIFDPQLLSVPENSFSCNFFFINGFHVISQSS